MASATVRAVPIPSERDPLAHYAFTLAFTSSLALLVSITVAHACLAASLILLLFSKTRLRFPPIVWPLAGFLGWTVLSALLSDDPAASWPQIKKFFVFATLPVVFSLFPRWEQARRLLEALFVCAFATALLSVVQFLQKLFAAKAAGLAFYDTYVSRRVTGFFSHWMTFSEVGLLMFLLLLSYVLFSASGRRFGRPVWTACGFVCGLSLVLSFTRSVWLAAPIGAAYLLWHWKPRLLWAVPVLLGLAVLAAPGDARRRLESVLNPQAYSARVIMLQTGVRMIETRPWFGLGPERVGPHFQEFLPPGIEADELPDAYYGHLHNTYVHYAAERGLPALAMLLWLLGKIGWDHRRALQQIRIPQALPSDARFLLHGVMAATLGVLVVGCFDLTLGDSEILGLYLTLIALGYRMVERVSATGGDPAKAASLS